VSRGAVARLPGGRRFGPFALQIAPGDRVAIVGPSGAGKSTLLKLMAGELRAHEGPIVLDGRALADWAAPALARRRAVLPQAHGVAFGMAVELVVGLGRFSVEPDPDRHGIVADALEAACATHLIGRRFDTLSGGEAARVMLARVFAQLWDADPGWLLVDEPLAALDPGLQLELTEALIGFCSARGHALLAIVHDLNVALGAFDRLWLVCDGRLAADVPAGRAAVPALEALFGVQLRVVEQGDGAIAVLARRAAHRPPPTAARAREVAA
jgi:iron complex transport system ATP-binding protein